jgi:DEAD/DEAH box helicase domain-containing protein
LGTLEESLAFLYLHPGAVYLHQGESYVGEELLIEKGVALVKPFSGSYYTQPKEESYLEIIKIEEKRKTKGVNLYRGQVRVKRELLGFVKRNVATGEILGFEELNLPDWSFQTEAYWFSLPEIIVSKVDSKELAGALHALEHAVIALFPLFALCDRWDVGGLSAPYHYQVKAPAVFFYDGYEGGIGLSARAFNHFWKHLKAAYELVKNCPCQEGCPSCIHSPKCGNLNEVLDKQAALKLFKLLLSTSGSSGLDR